VILKKLNIKYVVVGLLLIASILVAFQPSQNALAGRCDSKHTVRLNDTFLKIIKQYDLTPTELIQANNLVGPDYAIYVGQTLCIPPASKSTTTWWLQSYMTRPAGNFTPELKKEVGLRVGNFAPFTSYKVFMTPQNSKELYVGQFTANANGNASVFFAYPKQFTPTDWVKVCVQGVSENVRICRKTNYP
jgi:hypothetical protein